MTIGMDEAGRGCLAGPVIAAAVILPDDFPVEQLNDSKKISPRQRERLEPLIKAHSQWAIGSATPEEIDRINILQASLLAMTRAYNALVRATEAVSPTTTVPVGAVAPVASRTIACFVDGPYVPPDITAHCIPVIHGDTIYPCIMAASILAKVERDRIMVSLDAQYPAYGYARHKGYPTPAHKAALHRLGPSPVQRLTFRY